MLSCDNEIDDNETSKQNNNMGDNNKGGNQTNSEEEDGGKRDNESSSSDGNAQYEDDRDKANKEDIKPKLWDTDSDDKDENEQDRTEGDNKEGDNIQEDCEMSIASENVSCKDASNKQKSGDESKIRDDNVMTEVVPTDNSKKREGGKKTMTTGMKQIKRTFKPNFWRPIQMMTIRRMNKIELREITKRR